MEQLRKELRNSQPDLITAVHKYALAGYDLPAISRQTQLSINAVQDVVADPLPESIKDKLKTEHANFAQLMPDVPEWTYKHVIEARNVARSTSRTSQIDTAESARSQLLKRMVHFTEGNTLSYQQVIQGLKVIGVPQAGAESPAASTKNNEAPAQYVYDDSGRLVENAAYAQWRTKNKAEGPSIANVINIGNDVMRSLEQRGDDTLIADASGQVVGIRTDKELRPLQSLSAQALREEVYGSTTQDELEELPTVESDIQDLVDNL